MSQTEEQKYRRMRIPRLKFVTAVFQHRGELLTNVYERRNDRSIQKVTVPGAGFISSPTETKALRNITPIGCIQCEDGFYVKYPEKWLYVVEMAMRICPDDVSRQAMEMWIDGRNVDYVVASTDITRTTYYNVRNDVLRYAIAIAAQLKLIDVLRIKGGSKHGAGNGKEKKKH